MSNINAITPQSQGNSGQLPLVAIWIITILAVIGFLTFATLFIVFCVKKRRPAITMFFLVLALVFGGLMIFCIADFPKNYKNSDSEISVEPLHKSVRQTARQSFRIINSALGE